MSCERSAVRNGEDARDESITHEILHGASGPAVGSVDINARVPLSWNGEVVERVLENRVFADVGLKSGGTVAGRVVECR